MADKDVHLLDACRIVGWDDDIEVANVIHFASPFSSETDCAASHLLRFFDGVDDIGAIAIGKDADKQVPFCASASTCLEKTCPIKTHECMKRVSAKEVIKATEQLL